MAGETVNLGSIGFVWKGDYNLLTPYKLQHVVKYSGNTYIAKVANTGQTPPTNGVDTVYWAYITNISGETMLTANYAKAAGNVSSPLLDLILNSAGTARASYARDFKYTGDSSTTYIDRYGVLQKAPYYTGTATSGAVNSLTNSGAVWVSDELKDYILHITAGTGAGQYRWVIGNNATTLTVSKPFTVALDATSVYKIKKPRFQKDGFLCEPEATNYFLDSNTVMGVNEGVTVTPDTAIDPTGVTSLMDAILEDNTTGIHRNYVPYSIATAGSMVTYSRFVKAAGRTKGQLVLFTDGATIGIATFDLNEGTVVASGVGAKAAITALANGIFRVQITGITLTQTLVSCHVSLLSDTGLNVYAGTPGLGMYVYGGQLEQTPFATSLIYATTVPVTRTATYAEVAFAENFATINAEEVSIAVDYNRIGEGSTILLQPICSVNGAINILLRASALYNPNLLEFFYGSSAATGSGQSLHTLHRVLGIFTKTTKKLFLDGVFKTEVAAQTVTGTPTGILIGAWSSTYLGGHVKRVRIWDRALNTQEAGIA
ncbi:MAG: LamG domain-containing protein [Sulfuricurvum sp.]|jgi:hypothetical protein|uniref:phage head spike fiber domain-containing protein n=1 Tax=Sulfuricurvum sp. TaxID=2025608 RepID=UPI0025CF509D|nr:hypothetical protein [Sulfuricurvum sp.]MCK9372572.1 LamG domain-containing protein [Sulfuricurvum sp.]